MSNPTNINVHSEVISTVAGLGRLVSPVDGSINPRKQERFEMLSGRLEELLNAGSTVAQRCSFVGGALKWHANFLRMKDVYLLLRLESQFPGCSMAPIDSRLRGAIERYFTVVDPSDPARVALGTPRLDGELMGREINRIRANLWGDLPRSRFKLFMEAFSDPMNFLVPLKGFGGKSPKEWRQILQECHLTACLVSADRMPNKFLQSTKLIVFPAGVHVSGREALRLKQDPLVIDGLKAFWESLKRLEGSNPHLFIAGEHTAKVRERYPHVPPIDESVVGSLVYTREKVSGSTAAAEAARRRGEFSPRQVTPMFFATPYSFERKTIEQRLGYGAETGYLQTLSQSWIAMNREFDSWRATTPTSDREVLRYRLASLIAATRTLLERSSNSQKIEVERVLREMEVGMGDAPRNPALVLKNTGPLMAKMVKNIRLIGERSTEIPYKGGWNQVDCDQVRAVIYREAARFSALEVAAAGAEEAVRSRSAYFASPELPAAERQQVAESFRIALSLGLYGFDRVDIRPFRAFAQKLLQLRDGVLAAVRVQDLAGTEEGLSKFVSVWRLHQINHALEVLRTRLVPGTGVSLLQLEESERQLSAVLDLAGGFQARYVAGYSDLWGEASRQVTPLRDVLRDIIASGLSFERQVQLYCLSEAIRERLSLEEQVRQLPA